MQQTGPGHLECNFYFSQVEEILTSNFKEGLHSAEENASVALPSTALLGQAILRKETGGSTTSIYQYNLCTADEKVKVAFHLHICGLTCDIYKICDVNQSCQRFGVCWACT